MKLNEIDFNILSDKELVGICLKYKLIKYEEISKYKRADILIIIKNWVHTKLKVYGKKKESVKSVSVHRRMSVSGNIQKNEISHQKNTGPPRVQKQRRMSHPITRIEKKQAVDTHERNVIKETSTTAIQENLNMLNPQYDIIGMYPAVKKLVAIGDLHGDLKITLSVLKLAEVIPQSSIVTEIEKIHWY